jgi:hypothetical protein
MILSDLYFFPLHKRIELDEIHYGNVDKSIYSYFFLGGIVIIFKLYNFVYYLEFNLIFFDF